jgi:hypothetical protein
MAYDWSAPLPGCDWCGGAPQEDRPWLDQDDFWGHPACHAIAAGDPDTIRARRAREAWSI